MRLSELEEGCANSMLNARCRVEWEDVDRPPTRIAFALPDALGVAPHATPEAFLLAALAPAFAAGERRIHIDAPICELLEQTLPSALAILHKWSPEDFSRTESPVIETRGVRKHFGQNGRPSAAFYSGGVDSTHLLLANARDIPASHPSHIRHAISVYGFDIGGRTNSSEHATYTRFLANAQPFTRSIGIRILPLQTNLRHLDDRPGFWGRSFVGLALAAAAQALGDNFALTWLATPGEELSNTVQAPFGTHPSLAPYCNTLNSRIAMPYVEISRLARLAEITRNTAALAALRVCFCKDPGAMNCGLCEKCVRTQLGLRLHGIDPAPFFSGVNLDADLIDHTNIDSDSAANMAREMLAHMQGKEWLSLRNAVQRQIQRWERYKRWKEGKTTGGRLRSLAKRLQYMN